MRTIGSIWRGIRFEAKLPGRYRKGDLRRHAYVRAPRDVDANSNYTFGASYLLTLLVSRVVPIRLGLALRIKCKRGSETSVCGHEVL